MIKPLSIATAFVLSVFVFDQANAQSRFQQIQQGVNESTGGSGDKSEGGGVNGGRMGSGPAGINDIIFLGSFETYIPSRKYNARLTIYGEPRKFLLGHRACTKSRRIRDHINAYLFNEPPELDRKGRADTTGMDKGVRKAIKKALKTKLEYFTSIYVYNGSRGLANPPKELADVSLTDCAGVISKKADMDTAAGK
ncbi:hypothetical protein RYZ26_09790 [Terasakiella sp. A23]|uniref:hypothetical protein n=1 Tax=Terasakiella sp. FCG-A23 TaxID=3080561 RepID=UPI002953AB55|nr:hypothetical protein [Terasakiella sp. A23]MDV7339885.1 hypothetical protein [Terasakiella sp. A23]